MQKIVVFTSSNLRHKCFRVFLSNFKNIHVLKTFSEKGSNLKNLLKKKETEGQNVSLELEHLSLRDQSEIDFFDSYLKSVKDNSNNFYCEKGYISTEECLKKIKILNPDLIIVYGSSILKGNILKEFKNRILNVHLGLSPYYRGGGTNYFPFVNNEPEYAGATFMFLDEGIDTGEIIHQIRSRIYSGDNFHQIGNRLILDMFKIYCQIILNIKKIKKIKINYKNKKKLLYTTKDFTLQTLKKLHNNFNKGMIDDYLKNKRKRNQIVPLVEQKWVKKIDYNRI